MHANTLTHIHTSPCRHTQAHAGSFNCANSATAAFSTSTRFLSLSSCAASTRTHTHMHTSLCKHTQAYTHMHKSLPLAGPVRPLLQPFPLQLSFSLLLPAQPAGAVAPPPPPARQLRLPSVDALLRLVLAPAKCVNRQ